MHVELTNERGETIHFRLKVDVNLPRPGRVAEAHARGWNMTADVYTWVKPAGSFGHRFASNAAHASVWWPSHEQGDQGPGTAEAREQGRGEREQRRISCKRPAAEAAVESRKKQQLA